MTWIVIAVLLVASIALGSWAMANSEKERQDLHDATRQLGRHVDDAFGLTKLLVWLDRQLRRFPRLYARLGGH